MGCWALAGFRVVVSVPTRQADGVDRIAPVATLWGRMLEHMSVEVTLRTGDVLRGQRHPGDDGEDDLVETFFDPESACTSSARSPTRTTL